MNSNMTYIDEEESIVSTTEDEEYIDEEESLVSHNLEDGFDDDTDDEESLVSETDIDDEEYETRYDDNVMLKMGEYYVPYGAVKRGKGGQATIYECRRYGYPDMIYIAKVYHSRLKSIAEIEEMEKRVQAIDSINVVKNLFVGYTDDGRHLVVVMPNYERFDKENSYLNYFLHGRDRNYLTNLLAAIRDFNEGMKAIHSATIIHSDIKPDNIMCCRDSYGEPHFVYIDLGGGIDKRGRNENSLLNGQGNNAYTRGYAAPETQGGRKNKGNVYTDAYSAGVTICEYMAGVFAYYEELNTPDSTQNQVAYYNSNSGQGELTAGRFLLPKGLPPFLYRFFQGVLYVLAEGETSDYRWGTKAIDTWLYYVENGRYDEAANIQDATNRPKQLQQSQTPVVNITGKTASLAYSDGNVEIHSVEEMLEQFMFVDTARGINHWKETIGYLMLDEIWARSLTELNDSVANVLVVAGRAMKENPDQAEDLFIKRVINWFGSEQVKAQVIRNGKFFKSKATLGRYIYAALSEAMKQKRYNEIKSYNEIHSMMKKGQKIDVFSEMLLLFENNYLSEFFDNRYGNWNIDDEIAVLIRRIEDRMNGANPNDPNGKGSYLTDLFRISFALQNKAILKLAGGTFTSMRELSDFLNNKEKEKRGAGIAIMRELYTGGKVDSSYNPDVYAFMMDVPDIYARPSAKERPGAEWDKLNKPVQNSSKQNGKQNNQGNGKKKK